MGGWDGRDGRDGMGGMGGWDGRDGVGGMGEGMGSRDLSSTQREGWEKGWGDVTFRPPSARDGRRDGVT